VMNMQKFDFHEIEKATGGHIISGSGKTGAESVSTDSRKVSPDSVFFPLTGEKHDAHEFLPEVIKSGCRNIVISDEKALDFTDAHDLNVIKVDDTTRALQDLARWYLRIISPLKIGVTGSVGKTSTKDMTACVCSSKYKTGKTLKNQNNHIGLPLAVLSFDRDTEAAVLEMGMDHFGEIDFLADIVRPDIGVITNIGVSHKENLGSREGIFRAKMEITDYFGEENTLVFSQSRDFLQKKNIDGRYRLISTGTGTDNDFVISDINDIDGNETEFFLACGGEKQYFRIPAAGRHNAFNASLAVAAGMQIGIDMQQSAEALKGLELTEGRLSVIKCSNIKIIDDTYNASPDSMKAAVDVLMSQTGKRKIAILGDMFELGEGTESYHQEIGRYAAESGADRIFAIGELAENIACGAGSKGAFYRTKESFIGDISGFLRRGDTILVKASRGMEMEEIIENLLKIQETI